MVSSCPSKRNKKWDLPPLMGYLAMVVPWSIKSSLEILSEGKSVTIQKVSVVHFSVYIFIVFCLKILPFALREQCKER